MAKNRKWPHYTTREKGRWTTMVCTLPAGETWPNPHCKAHPDYQEPDRDDDE